MKAGRINNVNCVLLYGEEGYLVDVYEKKLAEIFVDPSASMFDFMKFSGNDVKVDDVIAACDTLPMISEKRVVLLSGFPGDQKNLGSANANSLAEYIQTIPKSTLLIISASKFSLNSALYKEIKKYGKIYKFEHLERQDARSFIIGRFESLGKDVDSQAVNEILKITDYAGRESDGSLYMLAGDVNRIVAYADGRNVTISDVSACMGTSIETDVFALLDSVSAGNKGAAIELAVNITSKNSNTFQLLSLLTGQFEIMLGYRELEKQGFTLPEIADKLHIKSEYRVKKASGYANKYSIERLMELLHRLYRVDEDIKSGLYNERLALTMFLAEM